MSSITTSYVKLAVAGNNENGQNSHIDGQEKLLVQCFKEHRIEATIDGERLKVSGECEDPFFETTFQIKSGSYGFTAEFLNVISQLTFQMKQKFGGQSGTVILHHPALFDERLHQSHRNVPTESVLFGNFWNNEFYDHWNICFNNPAPRRPRNHLTIHTHFHFDSQSPVTVEITVKEAGQQVKYRISIEGDSIRQLIVDQNVDQNYDRSKKRIYFVLKTPVTIKRLAMDKKTYPERVLELPSVSSEKVLTENRVFCLQFANNTFALHQLHTILSRLRCRWAVPIEFGRFFENNFGFQAGGPYILDNPWQDSMGFQNFMKALFPTPPEGAESKLTDRVEERRFTYTYLIEALLSRGSAVKDQLLLDRQRWHDFLSIIKEHVNDDDANESFYQRHTLCESALEDLLNHVDNRPRLGDLLKVFKRLCLSRRESKLSNQVSEEEWSQGYRKVRKVILTPTRKIYLAPEQIMANRAIRGACHDGTRIIRATLRDDNLQKMRFNQLGNLQGEITLGHLRDGFGIMERAFGYLASSNSQMREGGAYFMERYDAEQLAEYKEEHPGEPVPHSFKPMIKEYWNVLGKFVDTGSIPKALARLGQCFTQARPIDNVSISPTDYKMIPDVIGGKNTEGKPYMYTDGVGCISAGLAEQIFGSLGIKHIPCAFQFRFRGFKGMLAIDPNIDHTANYWESLGLRYHRVKCLFRNSQLKFESCQEDEQIEMVKWSCPTPVTLNKPFINILDQVSGLQSLECHKRVSGRVEELLSMEMDNYSAAVVNEEKCREVLEGMPRRIHFTSMERKNGFVLSTEPFFRSLVKASIDSAMSRLLRKLQIPIPGNLGRSMFGITDETGQLQYGQVFVRYTENVNDKHPSRHKKTITLTGKVLVTKFPSLCEGDVRMYEAVDIPELHHLQDVIVFPQTGPRSQPDEMAGSDLDGDEYALIWDPQLFFERNQKAFEYSSEKPDQHFAAEEMDDGFHWFYTEYAKQEDVGVTSINHLHQSDQFGINSDVCRSIAIKNGMALDYAKSGVAPPPLTSVWSSEGPPERSERRPDYANNRYNGSPSYQSSRLLGQLYRELRCVNDVCSEDSKQVPVAIDPLLTWQGWEEFVDGAHLHMTRYNAEVRSIMDTYGVATEAEIFSGCYREIRNRHSEKEQDDMSIYNTESVIETQMTRVFRKYREQFFEEFAPGDNGYMRLTEVENPRNDEEEKDVLRRVCRQPTGRMMAKAVAYYRDCYTAAQNSVDRRLSFAWIAYDILNTVRGKNLLNSYDMMPVTRLPQFQAICDHRKTYIDDDKNTPNSKTKLGEFISRLISSENPIGEPLGEQEKQAKEIIMIYVRKYSKLHECLFIIEQWARAKGLLSDAPLKWYHLSLLVIMVATNKLGSLIDDENPTDTDTATIIDFIKPTEYMNTVTRKLSEGDLDRLTLSFFHYLSTREFRRLRILNFSTIGLKSVFMRGEWMGYHTAATQTYFNILLNLRIDELPISTESCVERRSDIREGDPFILELPYGFDRDILLQKLRENSKCVEIQGRVDGKRTEDIERIVISCRGTIEAINELRDFAIIKLPRHQWQQNESMSKALAHIVYHKIMGKKFVDKKPKNNQHPQWSANSRGPQRQYSAPTQIGRRPRGVHRGQRFYSNL
ncbi:hypothetical protein GCK72_003193 [Caenorhabditis remanei]|uniref:RNA-directed RNA polymerase n=1 Tax=Caenorhabditis remanei TaxID=31234 RepID=A0A6A5HXS6_CAERE|nr:hypothetical protein GCK72_003193 [Caenorhabditis remanei]KAF1771367.1 hypothetical protein GCK72_003193 [Caenorhabditis remanei]